jgi:hypothetical protein
VEGEELALRLGPAAEKWAARIRNPPALAQKLGVRPGARVSVLGLPEAEVRREVDGAGADVSTRLRKPSDLVLAYFADRGGLARLAAMGRAVAPEGAVWALWTKGRKELREDDIRAAARPLGLVDVKVASVSAALSGLKLMWRRSRR